MSQACYPVDEQFICWFCNTDVKFQEKTEGEEEKTAVETGTGGVEGGEAKEEPERTVGGIGAVEDDLTLRAALYGVLFQSYTDKVSLKVVAGTGLGWVGVVDGGETIAKPETTGGVIGKHDLTFREVLY